MTGYPHGLEASAGRDYKLRGSEIVPDRTGGQMNVQGVLEDIHGERICSDDHVHLDNHCHACTAHLAQGELVDRLAPIIEKALRAAAMEMNAVHGWADGDVTAIEVNQCVTAGVAAMVEGL